MTDLSPRTDTFIQRNRTALIVLGIIAAIALIFTLSSCDGGDEPPGNTNITVVDEAVLDNAVNAAAEAGANDDGIQP